MKKIYQLTFFSFLLMSSHLALAAEKLSVDLVVDELDFKKPIKGAGKAGNLIFKSANVNNNGIVININNVNNLFDSEIFLRPTFIGFTTQFGNYGVDLAAENIFSNVDAAKLKKAQLILDDSQLNISGEEAIYQDKSNKLKLEKFRLYCQNPITTTGEPDPNNDTMTSCLGYLTLNGSYNETNPFASVDYFSTNPETAETLSIKSRIKSLNLRKDSISLDLFETQTVSNDSYLMTMSALNVVCAKDPLLSEVNADKLMKDCLNDVSLKPMKATLLDKANKTQFNLDLDRLDIKNEMISTKVKSIKLSDPQSTTAISSLDLNCKKGLDSNLIEIFDVLVDCTDYAKISVLEIQSTKADEGGKGSSLKNIYMTSSNQVLGVTASIKLLGFNSTVKINGRVVADASKKELRITVTDTKLPLGLTSVKVLMYFLKKNLISKDIKYSGNNITISF